MSTDTQIPLGGFGAIFELLASQSAALSSSAAAPYSPLRPASPDRIVSNNQHQNTGLGNLEVVFKTYFANSSKPIDIPTRKSTSLLRSSDESSGPFSSLGEYSTGISTPPEDEAEDFEEFVKIKSKQVTWKDEVDASTRRGNDVSSRRRQLIATLTQRSSVAATNGNRLDRSSSPSQRTSTSRSRSRHRVVSANTSDFESEAEIQTPRRRTSAYVTGSGLPFLASASKLTPAWVTPPAPLEDDEPLFFVPSALPDIPVPKAIIAPLVNHTKDEKRANLIKKFINLYTEPGSIFETNPAAAISNIGGDPSNTGIHVFVDGSNIVIGHQDVLKKARGIHKSAYTNRPPFAYSCFSLLMERGRPVARRVLLGSADSRGQPPWMKEARECGYEVSALERVMKVREIPLKRRPGGGNGYGTGQSSGSETPFAAAVKTNGEQGVDEILQMKMLESIVDYATPSTMVLATGDAAEAEYSGGFYKNVKRALEKGWNVELVCWKDGMNSAWQSHEITRWKKQFRIITLDPFSEELLGEYVKVTPSISL